MWTRRAMPSHRIAAMHAHAWRAHAQAGAGDAHIAGAWMSGADARAATSVGGRARARGAALDASICYCRLYHISQSGWKPVRAGGQVACPSSPREPRSINSAARLRGASGERAPRTVPLARGEAASTCGGAFGPAVRTSPTEAHPFAPSRTCQSPSHPARRRAGCATRAHVRRARSCDGVCAPCALPRTPLAPAAGG